MNKPNTNTKQGRAQMLAAAQNALTVRGVIINYTQKTPGGLWRFATSGPGATDITGRTARQLADNAWKLARKLDEKAEREGRYA